MFVIKSINILGLLAYKKNCLAYWGITEEWNFGKLITLYFNMLVLPIESIHWGEKWTVENMKTFLSTIFICTNYLFKTLTNHHKIWEATFANLWKKQTISMNIDWSCDWLNNWFKAANHFERFSNASRTSKTIKDNAAMRNIYNYR